MAETAHAEPDGSWLKQLIDAPWFTNSITALIIANAAILGVLTYRSDMPTGLADGLSFIDHAITCVFAVEIVLKLAACRLSFFRSGWNWFDFFVVGISLVPGAQAYSVLRALRVLRILRLLHVVPMMRKITEALLSALPGMGAILAVLGLVTYVAAVMATNLYGDTDNAEVEALFGDLPSSAFTLFQVMTMDGWRNEVVQKVMDDGHPSAWVFFLIFIFLASFAVLNLFIALIVEALQAGQEELQDKQIDMLEEEADHAHLERREILGVLAELRTEIAELRANQTGGGATAPPR
ncbi:MAG: ion transporter [Pseudomonadota bacterium]